VGKACLFLLFFSFACHFFVIVIGDMYLTQSLLLYLLQVVCGATAAAAAAAEITLQQAQGNAARAAASMQQPDAEESTEATITSTSSSSATEQEAGGSDTSSSSSLMQALQAAPQLLRQPGVPAMAAALVCAAGVAAMLPAQDLPAMSSLTLVAYLLCAAPQVRSKQVRPGKRSQCGPPMKYDKVVCLVSDWF
jgi:hypothetical protein